MSDVERRKNQMDLYQKIALLIFSQEQKGHLSTTERDQLLQLLEWVRTGRYTQEELEKKWNDLLQL